MATVQGVDIRVNNQGVWIFISANGRECAFQILDVITRSHVCYDTVKAWCDEITHESALSAQETQEMLGSRPPIPVKDIAHGLDIFLHRHDRSPGERAGEAGLDVEIDDFVDEHLSSLFSQGAYRELQRVRSAFKTLMKVWADKHGTRRMGLRMAEEVLQLAYDFSKFSAAIHVVTPRAPTKEWFEKHAELIEELQPKLEQAIAALSGKEEKQT